MNGDESRVERHRIARFPPHRTSAFPFPAGGGRRAIVARCRGRLLLLLLLLLLPLLQHLLNSVGQIETSTTRFTVATATCSTIASIHVHHIATDDIFGRESQQTLHTRIDVTNDKVTVCHRHQFYAILVK